MNINKLHWLEEVQRDIIDGGAVMPVRRCLVIHFTSGATAKSSIESMRNRGLSCHIVIDRDGTIYQCRPFNKTCGHAGESRWQDPNTKVIYRSANNFAIGIELANAGDNSELAKKWSKLPLVKAKHKNENTSKSWEAFPEEQILSCIKVSKALVTRYNLDDITGHDCIAPERKNDPGPAFPMERLRIECGFSGLPKINWL